MLRLFFQLTTSLRTTLQKTPRLELLLTRRVSQTDGWDLTVDQRVLTSTRLLLVKPRPYSGMAHQACSSLMPLPMELSKHLMQLLTQRKMERLSSSVAATLQQSLL